jgi:hypothetical protein
MESLRWFQFQPLRHLGAEADFELTSVDPHAMQDAGELARDSHDRASSKCCEQKTLENIMFSRVC